MSCAFDDFLYRYFIFQMNVARTVLFSGPIVINLDCMMQEVELLILPVVINLPNQITVKLIRKEAMHHK